MTLWLIPPLIVATWLVLEAITRMPRPRVRLLHVTLHACGCLCVEGDLVDPCAVHDPAAEPPVERWAAEIGDGL